MRHLRIRADLIETVGPPDSLAYLDTDCWERVIHVPSLAAGLRKDSRGSERLRYRLAVVSRRLAGYHLPRCSYDAAYFFNDADVTNQILLSRVRTRSLIFLDDGYTWLWAQLFPPDPIPRGIKRLVKRVLGLYDEGYRALGRIDAAYVFHSNRSKHGTVDFASIVAGQRDYLLALAERMAVGLEGFGHPDYVVLSQPLTEEGICAPGEEVEAVRRFVTALPDSPSVVLKQHPREGEGKYRRLLDNNPRVTSLPSYRVPYELLHAKLRPSCVVSFWSASLMIAQVVQPTRIVSLVPALSLDASPYVAFLDRVLGPRVEYVSPMALGRE
jgi:hypothetical protein